MLSLIGFNVLLKLYIDFIHSYVHSFTYTVNVCVSTTLLGAENTMVNRGELVSALVDKLSGDTHIK